MKNNYPILVFLLLILAAAQLNGRTSDAPAIVDQTGPLSQASAFFKSDSLNPQVDIEDVILVGEHPPIGTSSQKQGTSASSSACSATVDAGNDIYFCNTFPVVSQLIGSVDGNILSTYWLPSNGLSLPNNPITNVLANQTTTYTLTARSYDPSINKIQNGDFEQGNHLFTSGFTYSPGNLVPTRTYDVLMNLPAANPDYPPCLDHTTGFGQMLATSPTREETMVWTQEIPVDPLTEYHFSGWALRLSPIKGLLKVIIGADSFFVTPGASCNWAQFTRPVFSGGNTTINIRIMKVFTTQPTAIAIDDLALYPVCEVQDSVTVHLESVEAFVDPPTFLQPCNENEITLHGYATSSGPPVTYLWTTDDGNIVSGADTQDPVVNAPGTYTLTVSLISPFFLACTSTATVVVEENFTPISSWITPAATLNCVIKQTTLTAGVNLAGVLNYQWTASNGGNIVSGANSKVALINAPGTYTLLVTDPTSGCTSEAEIVMPNNTTPPTVEAEANNLDCTQSESILSGDGSSTGPDFIYSWTTPDGHILSGQDSIIALTDTVGTYILEITNIANQCKASDTVVVNQNTSNPLPVIFPADTISCLVSNVTILVDSLAYSGPQLIFEWTTSPEGNIVSGADSLAPVVNAPAWYTLSVTDTLNGCVGVDSVLVSADTSAVIAIANAPQALTCDNTQVQLNANGSSNDPAVVYQWTTTNGNIVSGENSATPTVDAAGTYVLLLTNTASGCTATDDAVVALNDAPPPVTVQAPAPLNCTLSQQTLQGQNANPTGMFNYQWTATDGGNILSGETTLTPEIDAAGTYTLLSTNLTTGCTGTLSVAVVQHNDVAAELAAQTDIDCFGNSNGALSVTASGGDGNYNYEWSSGQNTADISDLPVGTYDLTVTDGEDCSATLSLTLDQPEELLANASSTGLSAPGVNDGTAEANPSGGTAPYTYAWSNGESDQMLSGLSAGTYTVTVTDANDCTAVQTVVVSESDCSLAADINAADPSCNGLANGTATATPSGGTAPFTYAWSTGEDTQTIENLAAGSYEVTVTDAGDCEFTVSVTLTEPELLTIVPVDVMNTTCPDSPEGSATVLAEGGTGLLEIEWSDGQQGATATGLVAGAYTATTTDANGCTASVEVQIDAEDTEAPVIDAPPVQLPVGAAGVVSLSVQNLGIVVTDNCVVDAVDFEPESFNCLQLGIQTVEVVAMDASGNSSSTTMQVTVVDETAPEVACPASITRCAGDDIITYAAPVATDNCLMLGGQFDLIEGLPSGSQFPEGTTNTTYTFTDASGNVGQCTFQVTILSELGVMLDTIINDVGNQNAGGVQITASGSQPGYSYNWQQNGQTIATTEDLSGVGEGTYTLIVTDANGCTQEAGPFVVSNVSSTGTAPWSSLIGVYPNPTSGKVFVTLPDALTNTALHFSVFDATGRKVAEQHIKGQKQEILDWTHFADGLYTLLIRTEDGMAAYKVVLDK